MKELKEVIISALFGLLIVIVLSTLTIVVLLLFKKLLLGLCIAGLISTLGLILLRRYWSNSEYEIDESINLLTFGSNDFKNVLNQSKNDFKTLSENVMLLSIAGKVYVVFLLINILFILAGVISFSFMVNHLYAGIALIGGVAVYFLYSIISLFYLGFLTGKKLKLSDYPTLKSIFDEVTNDLNLKAIETIYITDKSNISVFKLSRGFRYKTIIDVGVYALNLYSEEEIRANLYEELLCLKDDNIKVINRLSVVEGTWKLVQSKVEFHSKNFLLDSYFRLFTNSYLSLIYLYNSVVSKSKYKIIDSKVLDYVSKSVYASSLAKAELFEYFDDESDEHIDIRKMEDFPEIYFSLKSQEFLKYYLNNTEELTHKINTAVSTNKSYAPTFKERLNNLSIRSFNLLLPFQKSNYDLRNEVNEIISLVNEDFYYTFVDEWEYVKQDYFEELYYINNFKNTKDIEELFEYAFCLERNHEYDKALKVYNKIIKLDKINDAALVNKALILLKYNDKKGIDLIKKAIQIDIDNIEVGKMFIEGYFALNNIEDKATEKWLDEKVKIYLKKQIAINYSSPLDNFIEIEKIKNIDTFKKQLIELNGVKRAFLLKKETDGYEFYVIGLFHDNLASKKVTENNFEITPELFIASNSFPENSHVLVFDLNENRELLEKFEAVNNSEIKK